MIISRENKSKVFSILKVYFQKTVKTVIAWERQEEG
nr:MAG TPA: hypothetical protein [Bacteriophage sp.]